MNAAKSFSAAIAVVALGWALTAIAQTRPAQDAPKATGPTLPIEAPTYQSGSASDYSQKEAKQVDGQPKQIQVLRPQDGPPNDLHKTLEKALEGSTAGAVTIVPDPRTNTLVIRGDDQDITPIESLVETLDTPVENKP